MHVLNLVTATLNYGGVHYINVSVDFTLLIVCYLMTDHVECYIDLNNIYLISVNQSTNII